MNTNYSWVKFTSEGQLPIGFLEIYQTITDEMPILIVIHYYPKLNEFSGNKICNVSVFFEVQKSKISEGLFHLIMDDIGELIFANEEKCFETGLNDFKLMMTQSFFKGIEEEGCINP